ncbi:MAG: YIP1 family protein [Actinobacteria bacterium]|nr:YIP1 family protein [Actinomycetota bacterium]
MEAIKNLVHVAVRPSKSFEWVRENPNWWTPLILLVITLVVFTAISAPLAMELGQKEMLKRSADMSPGELAQAKQIMGSPIFIVMAMISAVIALAFAVLIQSSLLHLGASAFGGRASFAVGVATVVYAQVPIILQQIIQSIYMSASGNIIKPGLSTILPGSKASPALTALLGRIDIFSIWSIILLIIGFSITYKISKGKAATIAIGYWSIATIFAVTLAAIGGAFTPPA